jgi:DNA-directed RNA polymerase subunit RPC12/RpoP
MPVQVPCLKCKHKFQVSSKLAGQRVQCPACGCAIQLPSHQVLAAKQQAARAQPGTTDEMDALGTGETHAEPLAAPRARAEAAPPEHTGAAEELVPMTLVEPAATIACALCNGLLEYDAALAGRIVACPHCAGHLIMPALD